MILTRTPMRISIGGGTDLPSYYRRKGGSVLSAAIDKYVYLAVNSTFTDDYLLKYSVHERVARVDDIEYSLIREVLRRYQIRPGIEIVSVADIPAGTGLGSSGSFVVGLLRALPAYAHVFNVATGDYITVAEIAALAVECVGLDPGSVELAYTGGSRGWKGDVPIVRIATDRIRSLGWSNRYNSRRALQASIESMLVDAREGRLW